MLSGRPARELVSFEAIIKVLLNWVSRTINTKKPSHGEQKNRVENPKGESRKRGTGTAQKQTVSFVWTGVIPESSREEEL